MPPVRVLHVLGSMSVHHSGPANAALNLAQACAARGVQAHFLTSDFRGQPVRADEFPLQCFHSRGGILAYAPSLTAQARRLLPTFDLCHIHGVWMYPTVAVAWEARRAGVPYIVSPHGMLEAFHFRGWRDLRNRVFLHLAQQEILNRAALVHFLSAREQLQSVPIKAPAAVVGNTVGCVAPAPRSLQRFHLLSLSYLHPAKNVECLLHALPLLPESVRRSVVLRIAGSGNPRYVAGLRQLAARIDPQGRQVEFVGEVSGASKQALLEWSSLLCLASRKEAQSMAVLEALAAGLPVVVGEGVHMPEIDRWGAGRVVRPTTPAGFAAAISELLLDPSRYSACSLAALELARTQFSPQAVGRRWADIYASLLPATSPR